MWGPLLLGCDGSPGIWWVLQQQNGSVLFQVDDAMLMFDKTTNRHRGGCGLLPPFRLGWGPVVSQGAAGHSCPFISPPDILSLRICILSRAWPYRRLLSRRVSCARNLQNCRHPRGAEERTHPRPPQLSPPPLPSPHHPTMSAQPVSAGAYLVPGNQSLGHAAPRSG